ncbi:DUF6297 family protein [Nonomuraea sp. NPDC004580]|uniref:DUF6297 family protein n=1 Tax=Nonomuraea sp. NPDC004580 TaxID=3154552 RepID=UPI0033B45A92
MTGLSSDDRPMAESGVRAVRAYLRSRGPAPAGLLDRYVTGFCLLMAVMVLGHPLAGVFAGLAGPVDPGRMGAGAALLSLALAGFLAGARTAGPVVLNGPDASWLLLSPLNRRDLLARPARTLGVVALVAGLLFGVGLLAVLGAPDQLVWRVLAALVLGVATTVGGMALAVLGQAGQAAQAGRAGQPWQLWLTMVILALLVLAAVAVTNQVRTVLTVAAHAPLSALAATAAGAVVTAGLLARRAWRSLDHIPARTLTTTSTRAGHVANATASLDTGTLTWIVEDNHWRARRLGSRRWPRLSGPLAPAWQDWRRLARRPGWLATIAGTSVLPTVLGQAGAPPAALAIAVLAGGLAVAATATSGARRDADNPALARLIGTAHRPTLAARAVLPALLSGTWTSLALFLTGLSGAANLPLSDVAPLGLVVAPALAAAALRMARRAPVDHSMPVIETPGGPIPTGVLKWAATGPDLALAGSLPALIALTTPGAATAPYLAAQAVWSAVVLAGYVWRSRAR